VSNTYSLYCCKQSRKLHRLDVRPMASWCGPCGCQKTAVMSQKCHTWGVRR
jgi:hypothetical protein